MNKNSKNLAVVISILFVFISFYAFSDTPPDPPNGGPGSGDLPVGGSAPLFGGTGLLVSFGLVYLYYKVRYLINKK